MEFKLVEKATRNKLIIEYKFYGGDTDTTHFEYEVLLENISLEKDSKKIIEGINKEIEWCKNLELVMHMNTYSEVEKAFDSEYAMFWDNAPNDPAVDYQDKCKFETYNIYYYDEHADKYLYYT